MNLYNDEQSIIISKRLKELRESKKLSLEALCEQLNSLGVDIGIQSLKNYEITSTYHTRFHAVDGMAIKTLYNLAAFYGVSTDYILGISEIKSPETSIQSICKSTGLNEQSAKLIETAKALDKLQKDPHKYTYIDTLDAILEAINYDYKLIVGLYELLNLDRRHTQNNQVVLDLIDKYALQDQRETVLNFCEQLSNENILISSEQYCDSKINDLKNIFTQIVDNVMETYNRSEFEVVTHTDYFSMHSKIFRGHLNLDFILQYEKLNNSDEFIKNTEEQRKEMIERLKQKWINDNFDP